MSRSTVKVIFSTTNYPLSLIIRASTWSKWSHCGIVYTDPNGDEYVIEATIPYVTMTPMKVFLAKEKSTQIVEFITPNPDAVVEAAKAEVGKPYDYTGILGVWLHRDWSETDRWFCSELCLYALNKGGFVPYRQEFMNRVTPNDLYKLNPEWGSSEQ